MKRKFFRYLNLLFAKENKEIIEFSLNLNDNSIEKISHDLRTKNFSYIENFMSKESHKYLLNNWPDINYFNHNKKIIKHYSSKAEWPTKNSQSTLSGSQNLKKFYSYLLSGEFKKFFDKLISFENKDYKLCAISASMASNDSYLIPHIDGVIKNKEQNKNYNFIYFIDGYNEDPALGGGTGFYKDNEFKTPIFVPNNLINSILIYNQTQEFYHGFKTIKCPKEIYRKTVNFQITPVSSK